MVLLRMDISSPSLSSPNAPKALTTLDGVKSAAAGRRIPSQTSGGASPVGCRLQTAALTTHIADLDHAIAELTATGTPDA